MMTRIENIKAYIKKNLPFLSNFVNLGFIQVSNALIQLLVFPIIFSIIGLEQFAYVGVANTYAGLASLLVNYGTNQSGIKDIAIYRNDKARLSKIFVSVYFVRIFFFLFSLVVLSVLYLAKTPMFYYFLFANMIVLAEVCNPFFFFVAVEKLFLFNIANLLSKLTSLLSIVFLVRSAQSAAAVNLYLGAGNFVFYILLTVYAIRKYGISLRAIRIKDAVSLLQNNFYLTGSNISIHLQQSFFVFTLSGLVSPLVLGAYTLCDKILWSFRQVLIALSTAVYPRAAIAYHETQNAWFSQKKKINTLLAIFFIAVAAALFLLAPVIISVLAKTNDPLSIRYLRCISLVPLIAALNVLNVLELLISNRYSSLFYVGVLLLAASIGGSFLFLYAGTAYYGFYPLVIESVGLLLCIYFLKQPKTTL